MSSLEPRWELRSHREDPLWTASRSGCNKTQMIDKSVSRNSSIWHFTAKTIRQRNIHFSTCLERIVTDEQVKSQAGASSRRIKIIISWLFGDEFDKLPGTARKIPVLCNYKNSFQWWQIIYDDDGINEGKLMASKMNVVRWEMRATITNPSAWDKVD